MKFIFVRHGKTHFNEINLTQGWCDSPLSKLGVKQVENMSLQLKEVLVFLRGNTLNPFNFCNT